MTPVSLTYARGVCGAFLINPGVLLRSRTRRRRERALRRESFTMVYDKTKHTHRVLHKYTPTHTCLHDRHVKSPILGVEMLHLYICSPSSYT